MPPYVLHARKQTGSMAIEAVLAEAGIPHDIVTQPIPETPEAIAAFARINPRLQVPVLIHPDGTVITEGPAILLHLADAFPSAGLAPPPGTSDRARHDRWLAFLHANVYEGMLRELFPDRYTDAADAAPVASAATAYVRQHFTLLEDAFDRGPLLSGTPLAVLDVYLWMLCYWLDPDWLKSSCPRIHGAWRALETRPALATVAARHFG